jgi:hypothetical protein
MPQPSRTERVHATQPSEPKSAIVAHRKSLAAPRSLWACGNVEVWLVEDRINIVQRTAGGDGHAITMHRHMFQRLARDLYEHHEIQEGPQEGSDSDPLRPAGAG